MTVLCNAITCQHNSKKEEKPSLGMCSLETIVLINKEREDYKDEVMDCWLYQRK